MQKVHHKIYYNKNICVSDGTYSWVLDSVPGGGYENWLEPQPTREPSLCTNLCKNSYVNGVYYTNFFMETRNCSLELNFVCEIEGK